MQFDAVRQIGETVHRRVKQQLGGEITFRILESRIVQTEVPHSGEDGIYIGIILNGIVPVNETQVIDSSGNLQVLDRLICETEIKSSSVSVRSQHCTDVLVIEHFRPIGLFGCGTPTVFATGHLAYQITERATVVVGQSGCVQRTGCLYVQFTAQIPRIGTTVNTQYLAVEAYMCLAE